MDTPGAPRVSQAEAARICGVSTATIRRRRAELDAIPDAKSGGYLISIPSLVAAGLLDRSTPPDGDTSPDTTPQKSGLDTPEIRALRERLDDAETRAARAEQRAAVAEAIARERGDALEVERATLRLLTQQPHQPPSPQPAPPPAAAPAMPADPSPAKSRRRWWQRRG